MARDEPQFGVASTSGPVSDSSDRSGRGLSVAGTIAGLIRRAMAPADIAPIVWFRMGFGLIMLIEAWRFYVNGFIDRQYIRPDFFFTYYGFDWVRPWPGNGMYVHFAVLGLLAFCILIGCMYRVATALFFLGFTYVFLLDQACYLNHFYLVCLYAFLLIFVPAHRAFSVDAWRKPALRSPTAPAWALWLLRAQICIVYFYGGVAKLNADWLRGEPLRHWLGERADFPWIGQYFGEEWMVYLFTYGGLLFDLAVAPMLLWPRTRWLAFGLAAIFNMTNVGLFHIGIFPWLALSATILLFMTRLPKPFPRLWGEPVAGRSEMIRTRHRTALALVVLYLGVQCLVPLRHWLYPGNVHWNELGHRFSWHMKLRSKQLHGALITALDPVTGATWDVNPFDYLSPRQWEKGSVRPDMVLQFCHHVGKHPRREGVRRAEVRAWLMVSLNYREPQLLVDPDVNLAAQPRTLGTPHWITPLAPLRAAAAP